MSKGRRFEPRQGDVWIISVDGFKQEPVVVVSKKGLIVAAIKESYEEDNVFNHHFDWIFARLNRKSVIRLNRLSTIEPKNLVKRIGKLKRHDLYSLISRIKSFLNVGA